MRVRLRRRLRLCAPPVCQEVWRRPAEGRESRQRLASSRPQEAAALAEGLSVKETSPAAKPRAMTARAAAASAPPRRRHRRGARRRTTPPPTPLAKRLGASRKATRPTMQTLTSPRAKRPRPRAKRPRRKATPTPKPLPPARCLRAAATRHATEKHQQQGSSRTRPRRRPRRRRQRRIAAGGQRVAAARAQPPSSGLGPEALPQAPLPLSLGRWRLAVLQLESWRGRLQCLRCQ